MYDNVFLPIFELVEEDLYKKNLTLEETQQYGDSINEIIEKSHGYYHPSLKEYGRKLSNTNNNNYLEQWEYFSERFDKRYDKISKQLGIPTRNYAYRINNGQYKNNISLIKMLMLNDIVTIIFMFSLLLIINVKLVIVLVFFLILVFLIALIKDL